MPADSPGEDSTVAINAVSHEGKGVARINNKTVFVSDALPQERVEIALRKRHARYDEAAVTRIVTASPYRVAPSCPVYEQCGGCDWQHCQSAHQLELKQQILLDQLKRMGGLEPAELLAPVTGPAWSYRRRMRLACRFDDRAGHLLLGLREKHSNRIVPLAACPVAEPRIEAALPLLADTLNRLQARRHIGHIELALGDGAAQSDSPLAVLVRHTRPLSEGDRELLTGMAAQLPCHLYWQPGDGGTITAAEADTDISYELPAHNVRLWFQAGDFIQGNAAVNRALVDAVARQLALQPDDRVLELFCGLGNFSLPVARHCEAVLGIEGDADLVARAKANAERNRIDNARFLRADLFAALDSRQVDQFGATKMLLDPPRQGAAQLCRSVQRWRPRRIAYVSCDPATLARDAGYLREHGYRLAAAGVVDMFPQTHHSEALAIFSY